MANPSVSSTAGRVGTNVEEEPVPEWILAREGINFIINDNGVEAEKLFLKYPNSLVMYAGYAFTLMMVSHFNYNNCTFKI